MREPREENAMEQGYHNKMLMRGLFLNKVSILAAKAESNRLVFRDAYS